MINSQNTRPDISPYGMLRPTFTPHADFLRAGVSQAQPQTGLGNAGDWPYYSFLEFSALPTAASCARLHTTAMLAEWDLAGLRDDAQVVVSELVSNAFLASVPGEGTQAAGGGYPAVIRLWLLGDASRLVVVVWDAIPGSPVLARASALDEHGRGLLLVSALGSDWGCYTRPGAAGKFVWAEFRRNLNGPPV
jgi:hypothetical protein